MRWLALLAQGKPDPLREPEVIWGTAGIALALLVGAFVIWMVDRWRKQATAPINATEELSDFRGMLQRGEITEDEYAKLRTGVAKRVKDAAQKPTEGSDAGATGTSSMPAPPTTQQDGSHGPAV
jgi:hypothetical protein